MRKFYIKRFQTINGRHNIVYIKKILTRFDEPKFFPCDTLKLATVFSEDGLKEFQLLGALPNIDYTVVEISLNGKTITEFPLTSF